MALLRIVFILLCFVGVAQAESIVSRSQGSPKACTPTYGANGSMTFTSVTTSTCSYTQIGKFVFIRFDITGTTGGTASDEITISMPVATKAVNQAAIVRSIDGTSGVAEAYFGDSDDLLHVFKSGGGNWGLGSGKRIIATVWYEAS